MDMSSVGREMLTELEGKKNAKYLDQVGLPTIGVGHLLTKSELSSGKIQLGGIPIRWTEGLTDAEVDAILAHDVEDTVEVVEAQVAVTLSQPQFDALVSFVFNVGDGAFKHSTLLKLLNSGNYTSVPSQMRRWVHSHDGAVIPVLVKRRETEVARWNAVA